MVKNQHNVVWRHLAREGNIPAEILLTDVYRKIFVQRGQPLKYIPEIVFRAGRRRYVGFKKNLFNLISYLN